MNITEGLLYINDVDAYTGYGAFLSEKKAGDLTNYEALMSSSSTKEHVALNYKDEDGEKLPKKLTHRLEPRDIELCFAIIGTSLSDYLTKRRAFMDMLIEGDNGWLTLRLPELGHDFKVYFKGVTEWEQVTISREGMTVARVTVKFREPEPKF